MNAHALLRHKSEVHDHDNQFTYSNNIGTGRVGARSGGAGRGADKTGRDKSFSSGLTPKNLL